jgi:hypothetical protein
VDFSEARDLFGIIFQIPGAQLQNQGLRVDIGKDEGHKCKVPKIGISTNCFAKEKPMDHVHESVDGVGVAGPRFHRGLHSGRWQGLTGARPSSRSGPRWLTARVATGRARHGVTGGPLTKA